MSNHHVLRVIGLKCSRCIDKVKRLVSTGIKSFTIVTDNSETRNTAQNYLKNLGFEISVMPSANIYIIKCSKK